MRDLYLFYHGFMFSLEANPLYPEDWREYRDFALSAMKNDPNEFVRTFEEESALPDEVWQERLNDARRGNKAWLLFGKGEDGKIVGMIGASRVENRNISHVVTITGPYVSIEGRDKGVEEKLVSAILQKIRVNPNIKKARVFVLAEKGDTMFAYGRLGFKKAGKLVNEYRTRIGDNYLSEYILEKWLEDGEPKLK